jgi:FkbM family methyltransferase
MNCNEVLPVNSLIRDADNGSVADNRFKKDVHPNLGMRYHRSMTWLRTLAYSGLCELKRNRPVRWLHSPAFQFIQSYPPAETKILSGTFSGPIWDVGANIGKFAMVLAQANRDQKVYAFEPNLTEIGWLAYNTRCYANIEIVPLALTKSGESLTAAYDPDFLKLPSPTGPRVLTISLDEALRRLGRPAFIKIDIEGGEYDLLQPEPESLFGIPMLVEWHREIPALRHWKNIPVDDRHTFLEPVTPALGA